jgi:transcriptional repressor NrdR
VSDDGAVPTDPDSGSAAHVRVLSESVSHTTPCGRVGTILPPGEIDPSNTASFRRRRRGHYGSDEGIDMYCPYCRHPDSRVVDSREADEGAAIRRRRACPECGRRFTTVEAAVLSVVKRSGVTEPFSREKVVRGVARACQGRHVDNDALNKLAQQVEDAVRAKGAPEIPSHEVGLAILGPLRDLDEVAYLRFASVYRSFSSAEDFEREITELREHQRTRDVSADAD